MVVLSLKRVPVPDDHVMLVSGQRRGWRMHSRTQYVLPIQSTACVAMNERNLEIPRGRYAPITCADGGIVDVRMAMTLKVNDYQEDVIKAAQCIGSEAINDDGYLLEFFGPKLVWAVSVIACHFTATDFMNKLAELSDDVSKVIGSDLNGFTLLRVELTPDRPDAVTSMGVFR